MTEPDRPMLHYEVHGDRGPFLLLVHGMLSSRAQWAPNLAALSEFARPVVVELLGHGRSPTPESPERYTPESYCREFETIRRTLGAERWLVIGQSLGAALTLRYGLEHPERVPAQVFTNSNSALAEADWGPRARPGMEAFLGKLLEEGQSAIERMPVHPKNSRLPPELKGPLVADAELHTPLGIGLTGVHTVPTSSVRERVRENTLPTLLVVGEHEKRFTAHREFAAKTMPRLEVVALPAGHAVNMEQAEGFNRAVTRFFAPHLAAV